MVKVIAQDTFDSVVKENMEDFDMSKADAIQEAKDQFMAQGVDLSNIVIFEGQNDELTQMIGNLKTCQASGDQEGIQCHSSALKAFLDKGLAERTLATSFNAYDVLVGSLLQDSSSNTSRESVLLALSSLLDGNPDPLNEAGLEAINAVVRTGDLPVQEAALDVLLNVCVRHEFNRQNVVRSGILSEGGRLFPNMPLHVARLWQALVQDDDVRVPFGKAHDHAREIVEDHDALTHLIKKLKEIDFSAAEDLSLLLSCSSSLSVRNEYCQKVCDDGGLEVIFRILVDPDQNKSVIKESLKLIKTLSGNDHVKREIGNTVGIPIIVNAISHNMKNKTICKFGCESLAALSLRSPENAKQIIDCDGGSMLIQVIKTHKETPELVVSSSSAIRNIVSRSREFCAIFIELDAEELLNEALQNFKSEPNAVSCLKAALRDLELEVRLEEQWKGLNGSLEYN